MMRSKLFFHFSGLDAGVWFIFITQLQSLLKKNNNNPPEKKDPKNTTLHTCT